jgi:hypothetical protein
MIRSHHISLMFAADRARELRGEARRSSRGEREWLPVAPDAGAATGQEWSLVRETASLEQALESPPAAAGGERRRFARSVLRASRRRRPADRGQRAPASRG